MSHLKDNRQRVFQAYRSLFTGQNALIRQRKAISRRLLTFKCPSNDLLIELGHDRIVDILQSLLKDNVFALGDNPKLDPIPSQAPQPAQKGVDAKVSVPTSPLKESGNNKETGKDCPGEQVDDKKVDIQKSTSEDEITDKLSSTVDDTSRYLPYIPFQAQHLILTKAQGLLEQACFDFTSKWIPELILKEMWDCPEAIELSKWTVTVSKVLEEIPIDAFNAEDYPNIKEILHFGYELRNVAVHRARISLHKLDEIVQNAVQFLKVLCDNPRALQLGEMHAVMNVLMWLLEKRKQCIEAQFQNELGEIRRLREALDLREKEAVDVMKRDSTEVSSRTGNMLEYSFREIFSEKRPL